MGFSRRAVQSGIAAAAVLATTITIPPSAANAGVTARCGFEEQGSYAYYYNCVYNRILVRVDVYGRGSANDLCIWFEPWERRVIGGASDILNAYALGSGVCNI